MLRLQSVAEGIARVGSIAGGALLLIASILICIDITLRYTLASRWAAPMSCRAMRWRSAAPGASRRRCSADRIRIDTVYVQVECACAVLDLLSLAVLVFSSAW